MVINLLIMKMLGETALHLHKHVSRMSNIDTAFNIRLEGPYVDDWSFFQPYFVFIELRMKVLCCYTWFIVSLAVVTSLLVLKLKIDTKYKNKWGLGRLLLWSPPILQKERAAPKGAAPKGAAPKRAAPKGAAPKRSDYTLRQEVGIFGALSCGKGGKLQLLLNN